MPETFVDQDRAEAEWVVLEPSTTPPARDTARLRELLGGREIEIGGRLEVTLAEGRNPDQIRAMMHEVHEAVLRTVDTRSQHIRVIVREVPRSHWATGDLSLHEMDAAVSTDNPVR